MFSQILSFLGITKLDFWIAIVVLIAIVLLQTRIISLQNALEGCQANKQALFKEIEAQKNYYSYAEKHVNNTIETNKASYERKTQEIQKEQPNAKKDNCSNAMDLLRANF